MSSQKYFIEAKYGFEVFSRATTKINHNTIGLIENSDFYINLYNHTSNNVVAKVFLDNHVLGTYELQPHSIYKMQDEMNPNQFFVFSPGFSDEVSNTLFSELKIEWTPIITEYKMVRNPNYKKTVKLNNYDPKREKLNNRHFGQTMLSYDRRINYGCTNCKHPTNTFSDDLNLGISSDKYIITQRYTIGDKYIQKTYIVITNPKYNIVNVRDYFVYNEKMLDVPSNQMLNSILL